MATVTTSRWAMLAAVGLVLSAPVVGWWLAGDLAQGTGPDHLLPPVDLPSAAGIAAAIVGAACAVLVVRAWWRRRLGRRWRPTVVMLVLAGAAFGVGWRMLSAGTTGSDPEMGKVLLIGLPAWVAFVGAAVVVGIWRRPERRKKAEKRTHIREDSPVSSADRV
ncbi:MAG: hypothetical protein ACRD12_11375 [Acidimicrobiales bacterium]